MVNKLIAVVAIIGVSVIGYAYVTKTYPTNTYAPSGTYESGSIDRDTDDTDNDSDDMGGVQVQVNTQVTTGAQKTYTLADVKKHATQTDCWTTVNGSVYNVTPWIAQHPGGAKAIISLCGIDGSDAFNGKHGGQARPESELASFKIGTLVK